MKNQRGFTLVEIVVTVAIMAVILGVAAGPFLEWYRKGKVEDRASSLHETFKWAQSQAMKGGDADMGATGQLVSHRVYIAVNTNDNSYKVVRWVDADSDNVKDSAEMTTLQTGTLGEAHFGILAGVNRTACGNSGALTGPLPVRNFNTCPTVASSDIFTNYVCTRFNSKGFVEGLENAALYINNAKDSYAVSLNPAGVLTLCKWNGTSWQFIR